MSKRQRALATLVVAIAALLVGVGSALGLSGAALVDSQRRSFDLAACPAKLVVVVFLGVDCPLAKLSAPRLNEIARRYANRSVQVVAVDSNARDTREEIARFALEMNLRFPFLQDTRHRLADQFGATRSPEAFLLDAKRVVRYHGRIDDQLTPGTNRGQPTRRDLVEAIEELLAVKRVSVPVTEAKGCLIDRGDFTAEVAEDAEERKESVARAAYDERIAPILRRHCVECHRPGQIAPFSLTSYEDAHSWAATIREVVQQGRMPPWGADPRYGRFLNERRLTENERRQLLAWCAGGTVDGPPSKQEADGTGVPSYGGGGPPDFVVPISVPQQIPAEGILEYRRLTVDPHFTTDRWISAVEVYPGNRKVLHHCTVFLSPPGAGDALVEQGSLGSYCLATYTPGTSPAVFPAGMAKLVPAGWRFMFVLHYVTNGTPATDQTSLGLRFADPRSVRREVATKLLFDNDILVAPGERDHVVQRSWPVEQDVFLLSMFPHMHLRGRSFQYEAVYPDGRVETLLSVPRYDFNWQHRYILAEPKWLPAGTVLRCTAHYDNSTANPNNPDPSATVRTGPLTTDEMFNAYFDFALAEEDRLASSAAAGWTLGLVIATAAGVGFTLKRRGCRPAPTRPKALSAK